MNVESILGIIASVIAIVTAAIGLYKMFRSKQQSSDLSDLMKRLIDKSLSTKEHRSILKKMNRKLGRNRIKKEYIDNFILKDTKKESVFIDICESNDIEPTADICKKFLGYDSKLARESYHKRKNNER